MNMCFKEPCGSRIKKIFLSLGVVGLCLTTDAALAADEDVFLKQIRPSNEQVTGYGHSALWTLSLVATQYQPSKPDAAMEAALQAQREDRSIDALILLDKAGADAETNLLRASFLLQGNQPWQAMEILSPLLAQPQHATDAWALTVMANLQLGQMDEALIAAHHAQGNGILPALARSYALQAAGRLAEARDVMRSFNNRTPQQAVALAREAELSLTLNQVHAAKTLVENANRIDAANPYVNAVNGLTFLIDGRPKDARNAFETALKRDPDDAKALLGLGLAETKLGNFQAGLKKLQAAHESDPGNALILTYLGRSQQNLGQIAAARASWKSAQLADPKDPIPWLYQAQAELQANRPLDARESLREAQLRMINRKVYRGDQLIKEDEQLLQANLAEIQRQLGLESMAFQTLATLIAKKSSSNLRNQADVLQGQRFGESARRSLLLQSMFNEQPGTLPSSLDIYGDSAGLTGASTPQHGVVSGLYAQQISFNNYDALFAKNTTLEADAATGSKNTNGEQIRFGVGNDMLGLSIAQLQFRTVGFAPFEMLDSSQGQAILQWQPTLATQAFASYQTSRLKHGETFFKPDPLLGTNDAILDNSYVTRLGLRHSLTESSELRGLWSSQRTDQANNYYDMAVPPNCIFSSNGKSNSHSAELQFRSTGASYATQWGVQQYRGRLTSASYADFIIDAQQIYAIWQQTLNPSWQLDAGLGLGKIDNLDNLKTWVDNSTHLKRWLPQLGVVYTPDDETHVRLAAWQGIGVPNVGDAALAPVSLAGILLSRPNDNGQLVHSVALAGDKKLSNVWLLTGGAQRRNTDQPIIYAGQQILIKQRIDESKLALYWQSKPWVVSLAYEDERIQNDPIISSLSSVDKQHLNAQQLGLRWFASEHWAANLKWSHNRVTGIYRIADPVSWTPTLLNPYQDSFNQVDVDLDWQFKQSGSLIAGVRNATDRRFQYSDIDPLNPRFSNGRMIYGQLKVAW